MDAKPTDVMSNDSSKATLGDLAKAKHPRVWATEAGLLKCQRAAGLGLHGV